MSRFAQVIRVGIVMVFIALAGLRGHAQGTPVVSSPSLAGFVGASSSAARLSADTLLAQSRDGEEVDAPPRAGSSPDVPPALPDGKPVPLSTDYSVAAVSDHEGALYVMEATANRFQPARKGARLMQNTQVKTGSRGAHAATLLLPGGSKAILGPAAQVILLEAGKVRVLNGEVEFSAVEGSPVTVSGPGESTIVVRQSTVVRASDGRLEELKAAPKWLVGYKESGVAESLGSLLATVDGRAVPLSLGYHRVTVDIRDQIARTVIEESFINHTGDVLEGVFMFPLPADASISGFAVWIGGQLVEADIVEKERARAIYEQLLKEKRDPGLLEWTGANLFKARIYPIHREKRIRIVYTQVLPKTGDAYYYNYALQSELLRQRPLDELSIDLRIWSDRKIAAVESTTHACRVANTENAARVQFNASNFVPDRDFEAVIRTAAAEKPVSLVTHTRGSDGYFMLQLDSVARVGREERARGPLQVRIVADTSGSMTGPAREVQRAALDAVLDSLGPQDKFNLALCDLDANWVFGGMEAPEADAKRRAREAFDGRTAMGWTDLGRTMASVLERAGTDTHIVYLGDGIVTSGDADPAKAIAAIRTAYRRGAIHALACGNTYDPQVIQAMGGLGGGSWRVAADAKDAGRAIAGMLNDIERPGMRDVTVRIEGMETAAVYPSALPNLPFGRQQLLVGRHNPAVASSPVVTVRGSDGGAPFEHSVTLSLSDSTDNSFVPRLWARHHLHQLMAMGRGTETKRRVVQLSEDFQIITPHTSLLVLESDELRERFRVEQRLKMRDGEEFFAEGRENAAHELARQQMLLARSWRQNLRGSVISWLRGMGRGLERELEPLEGVISNHRLLVSEAEISDGMATNTVTFFGDGPMDALALEAQGGDEGGSANFLRGGATGGKAGSPPAPSAPMAESAWDGGPAERPSAGFDKKSDSAKSVESRSDGPDSDDANSEGEESEELESYDDDRGAEVAKMKSDPAMARRLADEDDGYSNTAHSDPAMEPRLSERKSLERAGGRRPPEPRPHHALDAIFPNVGRPGAAPDPVRWPEAIADAARSSRVELDEVLIGSGLSVSVRMTMKDSTEAVVSRWLLGKSAWFATRGFGADEFHEASWLLDGQRGAWRGRWDVARIRKAEDGDASLDRLLPDYLIGAIEPDTWGFYGSIEVRDGKRVITMRSPLAPEWKREAILDATRPILLEVVDWRKGLVRSRRLFSDHRELRGAWWPGKVIEQDGDGVVRSTAIIEVSAIDNEEGLARSLRAAYPVSERTLHLQELPLRLSTAKESLASSAPSPEAAWMVLLHYATTQRWSAASDAIAALSAWSKGKPAEARISLALDVLQRRHEAAYQTIVQIAEGMATTKRLDERGVARELEAIGGNLLGSAERLALHDLLEPVWKRYYADAKIEVARLNARRWLLRGVGSDDEARAVFEEMLRRWPEDRHLRIEHAGNAHSDGDLDLALSRLREIRRDSAKEPLSVRRELLQHELIWLAEWGRWAEYLELMAAEAANGGELLTAYSLDRQLSILVMLDRGAEADALLKAWLDPAALKDTSWLARERMSAAIQQALGQRWRLPDLRDRAWHDALLALVLEAIKDDAYATVQHAILGNWSFHRSEQGQLALKAVWNLVDSELLSMPAGRLHRFIGFLSGSGFRPGEDDKAWEKLVDRLFVRWDAVTEAADELAVRQLIARHGSAKQNLRLARATLAKATEPHQVLSAARDLVRALQSDEWESGLTAEFFATLKKYGDAARAIGLPAHLHARTADSQMAMLSEFVTWALAARTAFAERASESASTMPRRQLQRLRQELRKAADKAMYEELVAAASAWANEPIGPWLSLEMAGIAWRTDGEPTLVFNDIQRVAAPFVDKLATSDEFEWPARDRVVLRRALTMMLWIGFRSEKTPEIRLALRSTLDLASKPELNEIGRTALVQWLIAEDKGEELRKLLSGWFGDGTSFAGMAWGRTLAMIQAEQNDLGAAISTLQTVAAHDTLAQHEWMRLADWQMALGDKQAHLEARAEGHWANSEWELENSINRESWRFGPGNTTEVTEDLITRIRIMMSKSSAPGSRIWPVQRIYTHTRDFRILEALANAVIGSTPDRAYDLVHALRSIIASINEEATVDRLAAQIERLRQSTTSTTDLRALNLLDCLTSLAAAQRHGQEPHATRALAALKQAFKGEWSRGEPLRMAQFIAGMGRGATSALLAEQERQLRALYAAAQRGGHEALAIASFHARLLVSGSTGGREHSRAAQILGPALAAFRADRGALLPVNGQEYLSQLINLHRGAAEWIEAEALIDAELKLPYPARRRWEFEHQRFELWSAALRSNAKVSLGEGEVLLRAMASWMVTSLGTVTEDGDMRRRIRSLANVLSGSAPTTVKATVRVAAREIVKEFAYSQLPKILSSCQGRLDRDTTGQIAGAIHRLFGPEDGVAYLVYRAENERPWLARYGWDFWPSQASTLGRWLAESSGLDRELETRLYAIVVAELRRDMTTSHARNRAVYGAGRHQWKDKVSDFRKVALGALSEAGDNEHRILHIAEYLYAHVNGQQEAINALVRLHESGALSMQGLDVLTNYMVGAGQHSRAVPFIEELVRIWPSHYEARMRLIAALVKDDSFEKALAVAEAAEAWLRAEKEWGAWRIAELARAMMTAPRNRPMLEKAERLWIETINLYNTGRANRWAPDWYLGEWYGALAETQMRLGKSIEALDSASAGIVVWAPWHDQRKQALAVLDRVFESATDFAALIAHIDAEVAKTGLENPILRKSAGRQLLNRLQWRDAIAQFEKAIEVAPEDSELHDLVVGACESAKDWDGMVSKLGRMISENPTRLENYARLADVFDKRLGQKDAAWRVATTIVEHSANESAGQAALAEWLMKRRQFTEAIDRWEQVIRIRTDEHEGYLGKLRCLLRSGQKDAADKLALELQRREWPDTAGPIDREIERVIDEEKEQPRRE